MAAAAALLLGTAELALQDGPLRLPETFLVPFAAGGVLTVWLDGCLALWPRAAWESLADRLLALPLSVSDARAFARLVFASAVEFRSPAEVAIPATHRRPADLDDRLVLVGAGAHAEIWSPDRWLEVSRRSLDELSLPIAV